MLILLLAALRVAYCKRVKRLDFQFLLCLGIAFIHHQIMKFISGFPHSSKKLRFYLTIYLFSITSFVPYIKSVSKEVPVKSYVLYRLTLQKAM